MLSGVIQGSDVMKKMSEKLCLGGRWGTGRESGQRGTGVGIPQKFILVKYPRKQEFANVLFFMFLRTCN